MENTTGHRDEKGRYKTQYPASQILAALTNEYQSAAQLAKQIGCTTKHIKNVLNDEHAAGNIDRIQLGSAYGYKRKAQKKPRK